nr:16S rRNA (uracil(1498)-N(3))-methyltransferase [Natranaerobius trueperi]
MFVSPEKFNNTGDIIIEDKKDYHYLTRVLRCKPEDDVILLNGEGDSWLSKIHDITDNKISFSISKQLQEQRETPIEVGLAQVLLKKDNFELVLQKTTELGVKIVYPLFSDRSEINYNDDKKVRKKISRWNEIVKNASEQSRRQIIPTVEHPSTFKEFINDPKIKSWDIVYICHEKAIFSIKEALKKDTEQRVSSILLLVGPEGGFSPSEISLAKERGVNSLSLGPRVLRAETAGITATTLVLYELADLGG